MLFRSGKTVHRSHDSLMDGTVLGGRLLRILSTPEGGLAAGVVVVVLAFTSQTPRFLTVPNIASAAMQTSIFLIVGIGVAFTILARGIDLSVGSIVAIGSVLGGMTALWTGSVALGLLIPVLVGAGIGLGNGIAVGMFGLSPLIVTLGSLAIFRGLALSVTGGLPVTGMPPGFSQFANSGIGPVRYPVLVAVGVFVVFAFLLHATRWGTYLYAIGTNPRAAEISGIRVRAITVSTYVISGSLAGVAGAILSSRSSVGSPLLGQGLEFQVLPMVFLGGMVFMQGRGSLFGVFFAVIFLSTMLNGLKVMGVQPFWQGALPGAALLVALVVQRVMGRTETWASG